MGKRKVVVKESVAESIAQVSWFIESKGLVDTAVKFSDETFDYFEHLAVEGRISAVCRDPLRSSLGYKCVQFKKKYTVVFIESDYELIICEFLSSKMIKW